MRDSLRIALPTVPVLETERLILRGPEPRDEAGYVAVQMSEHTRYSGGNIGRDKAWRGFAAEFGHWLIRGYGMWAVTLKGDDRCIGMVGLWYPEGWAAQEIGWTVWPEAEGKGIAYEAAVAARAHAYDFLGWPTAVSYIDPENTRSIRLAERLGCTLDPDAPHSFGDEATLVYRHPAPETLK